MRKLLKLFGGILAGIGLIIVLFSAWYCLKFWPRQADELEFGNSEYARHVLISTQGSDYKEAVVQRLVEQLGTDSIYIKVTDVSNLETISPIDWADIIILNTSIADQMSSSTSDFLERVGPSDKIMVVTTSGGGDFTPPNLKVDGITTASRMNETEIIATRIFQAMSSK